jgi:23S rRNA (pseudouridine1915-N3)-methyltransferase
MQFTIVAVGNLRERYYQQACAEYLKRLQPYAATRVVEVEEERVADENSQALLLQAKQKEAERIRKALRPGQRIIALDVAGRSMSSPEFAAYLEKEEVYGNSHFALIIGGSYGLDDSLLREADLRLSFSAFTFPHQLMRVILLEQLYRAMKIRRGEAYHK